MVVTTVAALPILNAPQPAVERATLLAVLDAVEAVLYLTVLAMMMTTCSTFQILVLLHLLHTDFNSTDVAPRPGVITFHQIF